MTPDFVGGFVMDENNLVRIEQLLIKVVDA